MKKLLCLCLAYFFFALALIGILLPGLPTVPFLLLTAWFAARGSERLHTWLYAHPQFGALLMDWEQEGAVSKRSKYVAVAMLVGSWIFLFYRLDNPLLLALVGILFCCVSLFLITRPEPSKKK